MKFRLERYTSPGLPDRWDCCALDGDGWGLFTTVYGRQADAQRACAIWEVKHRPPPPPPVYDPAGETEFEIP